MTAVVTRASTTGLRFVDADGHVLEHPTEMQHYAPSGYEERVWHIESGAAVVPPMDVELTAREIRRAAKLPGIVTCMLRPNPTEDWKPFNDPAYDLIWQAASETGMPIALHPFTAADLPGTCVGLRLNQV